MVQICDLLWSAIGMTKTADDYKQHLRDQLDFLERSASAYDQGHTNEAARIATTLRVLFHDTGTSTSLLTHLGAKNTVKLASKTSDDSHIFDNAAKTGRPILGFSKVSMVTISIGKCEPDLSEPLRSVDIQTWLSECLIAHPGTKNISRHDVIQWLANKDGGAHVDEKLPEEYKNFKQDGSIGALEFGGELKDIPNAPKMLLRTMADEVLRSPDLRALLT
jgi:hypothetical protein